MSWFARLFGKDCRKMPASSPAPPPAVIPNEMTAALVGQAMKLERRGWEIKQELAKGALGLVVGKRE